MASKTSFKYSAYYTTLSGDVRARYDEKIRKCGGIDPYTMKSTDLSSDPKEFPKITMSDITDYMINSVSSFTKQFSDNYKGTEAYSFFESGFVLDIGSKNNNNFSIVKGKVRHSQKMNEPPLQPWFLANLGGKIICAHCTCKSGLSETCSHVGAICYATSKIAEAKQTKSATEVLCKWNVPKFKEVSMSAAKNIDWRIRTHEPMKLESSFRKYCETLPSLSKERLHRFILKSYSAGDETTVGETLFPSDKKRRTTIRDEIFLASLFDDNHRNKSLQELIEIGKTIQPNISRDEIVEISRVTMSGQKSKFYNGLRRGRITGSNFKQCCATVTGDPSLTTIRRVINLTKKLNCVPDVKYQIRNKRKVIKLYTRIEMSKHEGFVYTESGLIINPDSPHFVGSPDGLISCVCHGDGCLEIKCLNMQDSEALDEFLTHKPNNLMNKYGNHYSLEKNHHFFYKVQLHINLTGLKYCDCVIWSPGKGFTIRVYADPIFWNEAMQKATTFHEEILMPELLGKFFTERRAECNSTGEAYEEEYEEADEEEYELISLEIELLSSDGE